MAHASMIPAVQADQAFWFALPRLRFGDCSLGNALST